MTKAMTEAAIRAAIRASQVAKGIRRDDTPERISLPDEERGRSAYDLERLDRINARLLRGYKPKKGEGGTVEEQREADLRARESLEREISSRSAERERLRSAAEADILAAARGEEVVTDTAGVRRVLDRDPLLSLARAGHLTEKQLEAGQAVRDLYDLRMGDAASSQFDGMPAGAHDHERFVANRFVRAKSTVPAAQLETAILNGHFRFQTGTLYVLRCWPAMKAAGMDPNIALRVLRWVCCEHNTLTSMGRGRAYDRNRKALGWALDVADEVLDGRASTRRDG